MNYQPMRWRICAEQPDWNAEMLLVEPDDEATQFACWWRVLNESGPAHATHIDGPDDQTALCGAGPGVWRTVVDAQRRQECEALT